jgi:hypothetical protein
MRGWVIFLRNLRFMIVSTCIVTQIYEYDCIVKHVNAYTPYNRKCYIWRENTCEIDFVNALREIVLFLIKPMFSKKPLYSQNCS